MPSVTLSSEISVSFSPSPPSKKPTQGSGSSGNSSVESRDMKDLQLPIGFSIQRPSYLPGQTLRLVRSQAVIVHTPQQAAVVAVITKYAENTGFRWLVLRQSKLVATPGQQHDISVPFDLVEGRVSQSPAALFSHRIPASAAGEGYVTVSHCMWQQGSFLMEMFGSDLAYDELERSAASCQ